MVGGLGSGWGTPPRWAWVVMVAGVVALLVLTPLAVRRGAVDPASADTGRPVAPTSSPPSGASPSAGAETAGTSAERTGTGPTAGDDVEVAVLGGSWVAAGDDEEGWPELLAEQTGWSVTSFAVEGGGFVEEAEAGTTLGARVDEVVAAAPDVVVVAGGRDDVAQPPGVVQPAARDVLDQLSTGLPDATVLVVGVLWAGEPAGYLTTIDNALRGVAGETGAAFADARGEGWLDAAGEPLTSADGGQLTSAGEEVLADRVGAALATAGVPSAG